MQTGTIAHTMYSHVTAASVRGWPHGFAHQSRKRFMPVSRDARTVTQR